MVISAETPARPPNPAAQSTSAAMESTLPHGGTQGSLLHDLHNFSFPILKWGSHRVLRCMGVNREGESVAGGGRRSAPFPEASGPRIRLPESGGGDDPGVEEVREKLMVHLREAADRMKLVVPLQPKGRVEAEPAPEATHHEADTSAALPWKLRTRQGAARAEPHRSRSPPGEVERRPVRLRSEDPKQRARPKFSISLTREEIEEDIYSMTGCRARRRPRKRPRVIQKQLEPLFPGAWLSEITADMYKVPDSG